MTPGGPDAGPSIERDLDSEVDEPATPGRTVPAGALVVAIMVAAALGILAVVALTVSGSDDDSEVHAARIAAGRFGERFLTFEQDGIDEWKAGVLSLSTGGFSEEVNDVEEGLERLISEAELDATARVTEIFMGEIDDGQVSAILRYDRDLRSPTDSRSESDRYMQVRLLLIDGDWLVDDVVDITTAPSAGGGAPAATAPEATETTETTATTGPAPAG